MKKRPKILIIMMLIVALVGCSPAWAEEGDAGNANSDIISGFDGGNVVPDDETGTDAGGDNNSDSGSGESGEPGTPGTALGGNDGGTPTVNISDESIEAIAYAVTRANYQFANQVLVKTDDDLRIILDTNMDNLWDDYTIAVAYIGGQYAVFITEGDMVALMSSSRYKLANEDGSSPVYTPTSPVNATGTVFSFDTLPGDVFRERQDSGYLTGDICFSNKHIYADNGVLFYESPYAEEIKYTVSFVTGLDYVTYPDQQVSSEADINIPAWDTIPGHIFHGWYFDEEFIEPYRPGREITGDTVLYAKIELVPLVSFEVPLFEDMVIEPQYANVLQLPQLEKEGYVFLGWFYDEAYLQDFNRTDEITEDITLYGRFVEESYMNVFTESVFDSLTSLFEVQAIRYILAIMALVIIFGAIKILTSFRS